MHFTKQVHNRNLRHFKQRVSIEWGFLTLSVTFKWVETQFKIKSSTQQ